MSSMASVKNYGEILATLGIAMEDAGGQLNADALEEMTAIGLLKLLANNSIRFLYVGKKKESK